MTETVKMPDMFGCMNMKVVVGLNVVGILTERMLVTDLDGRSVCLATAMFWPLGHPAMMEMVHLPDMFECMSTFLQPTCRPPRAPHSHQPRTCPPLAHHLFQPTCLPIPILLFSTVSLVHLRFPLLLLLLQIFSPASLLPLVLLQNESR